MKVRFTGTRPEKASDGAAGFDLKVTKEHTFWPGKQIMMNTGTRVAIPEGCVGLVFIRSGIAARGLSLVNGVGVIDPDYRGEIKIGARSHAKDMIHVAQHERVAQLIVMQLPEVRFELDEDFDTAETARGEGGFGSTGKM